MIRPAPKTNKENYSTIQIRVACNYHIQLNFFCSLKTDRDCRWTDNLNIMFDLGYWNKECILLQCIFFNIKKYLSNRVIYFKFINLYQYFDVVINTCKTYKADMCILERKQISHNTWGYCVNNAKNWSSKNTLSWEKEREREIDRMEEKERQPYRDWTQINHW